MLKNLVAMGEKLKELRAKMIEKEAEYLAAQKEYEHYANELIPQEMCAVGVTDIGLAYGCMLKLKHNFYCRPSKDLVDKRMIIEWLRANGGGHIVEHDAIVSADDMKKLDANGIPYVEKTVVNTTRLKSFIKNGIGAAGSVKKFSITDVPNCAHFNEIFTAQIEMPM